ncbi:MAG: nitrogen fixation protein NifM [Zoogloeaceae bacterium]|jgi:nitrogen fixation protein NifM|nr:nitrogen fixation protein NifM [Zoogloeaceae bacterium]
MNAPQPYLDLKLSLNLFQKPPRSLDETESACLREIAGRQARIEAAILASPEARNVLIPEATRDARLEEIRQRYSKHEEFLDDMRQNGLTEEALADAVYRDIRIEAVLERVASQASEVSEEEARTYYRQHPRAFTRPETRRIRHILVTYDDAAQKQAVRTRLETLRARIRTAEDFAAAALEHSQCPTALEQGIIGTIRRGQIFPELEAAAFALAEGEISTPLESPVGLHLLFCDAIWPETTLSFAEARAHILDHLGKKHAKRRQKAWIRGQLR